MGAKLSSFASLIEPVLPKAFFSTYWEKQPLHIRRSNDRYYKDLITLHNVQSAISFGELRYPSIQLSKGGGFLPPEAFCIDISSGDIVFSGVPDMDRLHAEYQSGATISLPGFHRAWKPLRKLASAVEEYLDHAVHTNIYITPGNASGFSPHYDTHDVFILQISGSKHWKIYNPPLGLPHRTQPYHPQMPAPTAPLLELDLEPGDLLYMPRGFVHQANTTDCASMHVTLGVTVYTFVELIAVWLQSSKNEAAFRRALPPGFAKHPELKQGIKDEFSRLVADLTHKFDVHQTVETFLQHVMGGYPGRSGPGREIDLDVAVIGPRSKFKALESSQYAISEEGENIVLKFGGKTLVMSRRARSTLDEMCKRESFQSADLPQVLKEETRLALIQHLCREGFLMLSK